MKGSVRWFTALFSIRSAHEKRPSGVFPDGLFFAQKPHKINA